MREVLQRLKRANFAPLLILACYGLLMLLLVRPWRDYLALDDWAFAYSVERLVSEGKVAFIDWSTHYFHSLLAWAGLWAVVFGFSFGVLHVSTWVLSLAGLLAFYGVLRELNVTRPVAWAGVLAMAAMPPFFFLSMTFMGEVPFWSSLMISVYFFVAGQKRGREDLIWWGVAFNLVAFFIKQYGFTPVLAFLVYRLLNRRRDYLDFADLLPVLTFGVVAGVGYLLSVEWFGSESAPALRPMILYEYYSGYFSDLFYKSLRGFLNLSLLLAPVAWAVADKARLRQYLYALLALLAAGVSGILLQDAFPTPLLQSYVFNWMELGQSRNYILGQFEYSHVVRNLNDLSLVVSLLSGAVLLIHLLVTLNNYRSLLHGPQLIAYLHGIFLAVTMGALWLFNDRYYIWLAPWLILMLCRLPIWNRGRLLFSVAFSAVWLGVSVTGTLDHISHQQTLMKGYRQLVPGFSPLIVDPGYTINGWYAYAKPSNLPSGAPPRQNIHSICAVQDDPYWILAKSPVPGYQAWKIFEQERNFWAVSDAVYVSYLKVELRKPEKKKKKPKVRRRGGG